MTQKWKVPQFSDTGHLFLVARTHDLPFGRSHRRNESAHEPYTRIDSAFPMIPEDPRGRSESAQPRTLIRGRSS